MASVLSGKSVVVTGAANGIGLSTARRFVQAGASVMMADIDEDKLAREVETLESEGFEGQAQFFHGDLREKLTRTNLVAATVDAFDNIHVLVNAAWMIASGDPLNPREDRFDDIMQQNVTANLRMSQIAAKRMIEYAEEETPSPSDRCILNISSIYAQRSLPDFMSFSVASAAVNQLTRCMATTLAKHGIRANCVALGGVFGDSLEVAMPEVDDLKDVIRDVTPLGQSDGYHDAAQTAVFLASSGSRFTTGQILTVDGGRDLIDPLDTAVEQTGD